MQNKTVIFKMIAYAKSAPCPKGKDSQKWNKSQQAEKDIYYYRSGKYIEYITDKGELPIFDLDGNILDADVVNEKIAHRDKKQWIWDSVVSWGAYAKNNPLDSDEIHSLSSNFPRLDFSDPKITGQVIKAMMQPLLQGSNLKLPNMNCFFVIHHGNEHGKECENDHIHAHLGFFEKKPTIRVHHSNGGYTYLFNGNLGWGKLKRPNNYLTKDPPFYKKTREAAVEEIKKIFNTLNNQSIINIPTKYKKPNKNQKINYQEFAKTRKDTVDFLNIFLKTTKQIEKEQLLEPLIKEFGGNKKYLIMKNMYYNNLTWVQKQIVNMSIKKIIESNPKLNDKYNKLIDFSEKHFEPNSKEYSNFMKNNFFGKYGVIPRMANVLLTHTNNYLKEKNKVRNYFNNLWKSQFNTKTKKIKPQKWTKQNRTYINNFSKKQKSNLSELLKKFMYSLNRLDYLFWKTNKTIKNKKYQKHTI